MKNKQTERRRKKKKRRKKEKNKEKCMLMLLLFTVKWIFVFETMKRKKHYNIITTTYEKYSAKIVMGSIPSMVRSHRCWAVILHE